MDKETHRARAKRLEGEQADLEHRRADEMREALRLESRAARMERKVMRTADAGELERILREANPIRQRAAAHRRAAAEIASQITAAEDEILRARRDQRRAAEFQTIGGASADDPLAGRSPAERRLLLGQRTELHSASVSASYLERLPARLRVLFAAADPRGRSRLALGEEVRDVERRLRESGLGIEVGLESVCAVRTADLVKPLTSGPIQAVHFSGDGAGEDQLTFLDGEGHAKIVCGKAIGATLATIGDEVRLVVLTASYGPDQAADVVEHVPVAIGMPAALGPEPERAFAAALYGALAEGRSVARAFERATAAVAAAGVDEASLPVLHVRRGVRPDEVVVIRPSAGVSRDAA